MWADRWAGDAPVIGGGLLRRRSDGHATYSAPRIRTAAHWLIEMYAERYFRPRGAILGVRAGRFRMPFGIYTRSDYGYTGFLRPPLIRYDGYFGVSNNWLEEGAMFTAGVPQLFVEASVSRPHDVGFAVRRDGTDASVRVQGYRGQFVVGASHARSNPYLSPRFAVGRQAFTGVDVRWAHPAGVQARGEFLKGHSYEGVSTIGWYVDGIVHRPGMGPFTALVSGQSGSTTTAAPPRARDAKRADAGHASPAARPGHAAAQLPAPARRPAAHQVPLDRLQRDVLVPRGSLKPCQPRSATRSGGTIAWRPRVAAGILLLVTLSLAAVVFTATRVTTRSAVGRAADNLEGARAAFYRLVDERAEFAARQTRLITELPLFRSMMINPVIAKRRRHAHAKWRRATGRI